MTTITIKGHKFAKPSIKDSFYRRSQVLENKILQVLKNVGVKNDQVDVKIYVDAQRNYPAKVTFYYLGYFCQYEYSQCLKFVENLAVVCKVLELEVARVIDGHKNPMEFAREFESHEDVDEHRQAARETLGLSENEKSMDTINEAYKQLAKKHHPDAGGDMEKFKEINKAHKLLKKELS